MTRYSFIEMFRRQIYGGQPSDDASISINLVNVWLNQAIAVAAKQNYKESVALEGIGYVNNSFYSRFTGLSVAANGNFFWKISLPEIPIGIGEDEGISTLELVDNQHQVSRPFVAMTEKQKSFYQGMRPIPNKVLYYYEGSIVYIISTLLLNLYTVNVTMVSGGNSTDLSTQLNVPNDYFPVMIEYLKQQLGFEKVQPVDRNQDGEDVNPTA